MPDLPATTFRTSVLISDCQTHFIYYIHLSSYPPMHTTKLKQITTGLTYYMKHTEKPAGQSYISFTHNFLPSKMYNDP